MNGKLIALRILMLAEERGIKKDKLGEIAGAAANSTSQWKYDRINRFLRNLEKDKLDLTLLREFAKFFNISLDELLSGENHNRSSNSTYIKGNSNTVSVGDSSHRILQIIDDLDDNAKDTLLSLFLKKS